MGARRRSFGDVEQIGRSGARGGGGGRMSSRRHRMPPQAPLRSRRTDGKRSTLPNTRGRTVRADGAVLADPRTRRLRAPTAGTSPAARGRVLHCYDCNHIVGGGSPHGPAERTARSRVGFHRNDDPSIVNSEFLCFSNRAVGGWSPGAKTVAVGADDGPRPWCPDGQLRAKVDGRGRAITRRG